MTVNNQLERGILHRDKNILAPMVRCGTLPLRLTCLDYGADLVYSPEIIDKRIIGSDRIENKELGTVDFVKKGALVIRIHPREKPHLIFQMGTADPDLALEAAMTVVDDVAGIDVNCGCPKKFSIQGGMGAALLTNPDKLIAILTKLVNNVPKPVSCKIRVFDSEDETMELVDKIVATGVTALAIHCRTRDERPAQPAHWDRIQKIVKKHQDTLPIIVNGDVFHPEDIQKAKDVTGCCSVMIARGALINPSLFLKTKVEDMDVVVKKYITHAVHNNFIYQNIKYTLLQMYPDPKCDAYLKLQKSKSNRDICESFDMDYDSVIQSRPKLINQEADSKQNEETEKTSNSEETLKRPIETEESENPDNKQLKLDN